MDFKLLERASDCYIAFRDSDWLKRASDRFDRIFKAFTTLDLPKDPNKPDIVELESRILYSANPFFSAGTGEVAAPLGAFECPDHIAQDDWDTLLLAAAPNMQSESFSKLVDSIKSARGIDGETAVVDVPNVNLEAVSNHPDVA